MPQPTVDTHSAARYIGMSASFLRKSRSEGRVGGRTPGPPYIKIGRAVRYRVADLDAWLEEHRRERPARLMNGGDNDAA